MKVTVRQSVRRTTKLRDVAPGFVACMGEYRLLILREPKAGKFCRPDEVCALDLPSGLYAADWNGDEQVHDVMVVAEVILEAASPSKGAEG